MEERIKLANAGNSEKGLNGSYQSDEYQLIKRMDNIRKTPNGHLTKGNTSGMTSEVSYSFDNVKDLANYEAEMHRKHGCGTNVIPPDYYMIRVNNSLFFNKIGKYPQTNAIFMLIGFEPIEY